MKIAALSIALFAGSAVAFAPSGQAVVRCKFSFDWCQMIVWTL